MTPRIIALAGVLAAGGTAVTAQGFTGAELSAETLAYSDDSGFGQTTYRGALEFNIWGAFSAGADFSYHGFRGFGGEATALTLHGIYDLGMGTTVGLFFGQDWTDPSNFTHYGLEAATEFGAASVEGFLGQVEGDGGDGSMFGVSGSYAIGQNFGIIADFGRVDAGLATTRASIGGEMTVFNGPQVFATVGQISNDNVDESFVTLGASIAIGGQGGTSFGPRGIYNILN